MEPLLDTEKNRYVIFPIQKDDYWNMYKKSEANFWTTEELDLSNDLNDWNKLNDNEKFYIKMVFCIHCICLYDLFYWAWVNGKYRRGYIFCTLARNYFTIYNCNKSNQ